MNLIKHFTNIRILFMCTRVDEEIPAGFPVFKLRPTMQSIEKDRNALLVCKVTGDPQPVVTWFKDMIPIDITKPRYSLYSGGMYYHQLFYLSFDI